MGKPMIPALSLVLLVAASSAQAAPECRPESPLVGPVRAVATGIVAADNERDIARVLAYYAADAILLPPGEGPVVGQQAIRPRYEALFSGFVPEIQSRVDEACVADGLAFVRGHNGGRLVGRDGQGIRDLDDDYLMVLGREADGVWRISHLIWNRARGGALSAEPKGVPVTTRARGTFEVKLAPQALTGQTADATLGRMSIDKQFKGDLEGTSTGEMLSAGTSVKGSAGYVAIERVSGTLQGRRGTFVLQHSGTMTRGAPQLSVTVVPDSGTGQLVGLMGTMAIDIADGKHSYDFEYTLTETAAPPR
jgi:uncharacterized protein (TIGR02246 family)